MGFWQAVRTQLVGPEAVGRKVPVASERSTSSDSDSNSLRKGDDVIEKQIEIQDGPFIDLTLDLSPEEIEYRSKSKWFKLRKFLWDGTGKHPKEQRYLLKLDFFLLSSSMLGYFIKNLNQGNVTTAYVNGMDQYYNMNRNQYNYMITLWTVGYIIGQIPSNLILHRISARYYLGFMELSWAVLTILMVTCKNIKSMYALRFLIGLLESGYFPGLEYLMGSNYSAEEISSRSSYFAVAGNAAGLITGPLQLAVIRGFPSHRFKPFQWLFIIDSIISFPIAFYTMFVDPNTPSTTDVWYFTEEDKLVGLERRRRIGAQLNTREKYTWKKIKSFFNTWHVYVFPPLFLAYNNACTANSQPTFQRWMKMTLKLGPEKFNTYPSIVSGVGIAATVTFAYFHNFIGGRQNHYFVALFFILMIFGCASLSVWDIPRGLHWACYFFIGVPTSWGQPFIFSWVNRLLFHDDMKRNFVVVVTNTAAYVTGAWVPILTWNTEDGPEYFIGFTYTACLASLGLVITAIAYYFTRRDTILKDREDALGEITVEKTRSIESSSPSVNRA